MQIFSDIFYVADKLRLTTSNTINHPMTAIPIPIPTFLTFHVDKTSGELCPFIQRNQMRVEVGRYESDMALPYQYSLAKCGY